MRCIDGLFEAYKALDRISERTSGAEQDKARCTVENILKEVKENGDAALYRYTELFDGFKPNPLEISPDILQQAWEETPPKLQTALQLAHRRIKDFHQHQRPADLSIKGVHGETLGRRWRPVQHAGIYIPGGRASYPSTVLMNAVPAQVAGVEQVTMVSPGGKNGKINTVVLAAAHLAGINKVFRIGGAQSIGALAFGTETIEPVDVITGPGNIYVTLAKKSVYGKVGIDSLAGPSEVLIIADHTAQIEQIAADLLAQAEHDPLAASILLTTESNIAAAIPRELKRQLKNHPRAKICQSSLANWGLIVICEDLKSCIELSNKFAPEHLELLIENPHSLVEKSTNAGAIFIGNWTPEAIGDYLAGPNHTLPTSGTARFSGALGVETFMKNTSLIEFTQNAFDHTSDAVMELAKSEGLHSHSESIRIRKTL
ncbi:histidinol dehydrogenase [Prochlorococcus sp. MIT 1307]|uniref:histidinol dehydrogenase n=1 Tax=Prochlorococcus sp. MIT 1307 TaxID=3096219 RepID=UPI002A74773A|nr:histidinol dehydrogenase [Prochlorococcus sp. MIT 1307]